MQLKLQLQQRPFCLESLTSVPLLDDGAELFDAAHAAHHPADFFLLQLAGAQALVAQLDLQFFVAGQPVRVQLALGDGLVDGATRLAVVGAVA